MMSVLIKGMEMPECCDVCAFSDWSNLHQTACCKLIGYEPCFDDFSHEYNERRSDDCPLVALPEKHGDLIDRDEVRNDVFRHLSIKGEENLLPAEKSIFGNLIKAKAVIKAEGEE